MVERRSWRVRNKNRLLIAIMKELAGDARISFEGDLRALALSNLSNASSLEDATLKRNTFSPKQDFLVLPLETSTLNRILASIGGTVPRAILHIQIEKHGQLEFGAYDNFHSEALFFGPALRSTFVDSLVAAGILKQVQET